MMKRETEREATVREEITALAVRERFDTLQGTHRMGVKINNYPFAITRPREISFSRESIDRPAFVSFSER